MKSTLATMTLSLTGICLVTGAVLAGVSVATQEPIAESARKSKIEAIEQVLPPFDNDISSSATDGPESTTVYLAEKDGKNIGAAVQTWTDAGFGGRIDLLVGFNADGSVNGFRVLQHAETPGLGANMERWFGHGGKGDITGKRTDIKVKADGGDVDAISGATITSRAFADAVNRGRRAFENTVKQ